MTALGAKKHNHTGRSTPERKVRSGVDRLDEGPFAPRYIEMLKSPAYRVLSQAGHRLIARLEIENAVEGGANNGNLICLYADFELYGMARESIAPAIRETAALGFVDVTPGRGGIAEFRRPSVYRLTYRHTATAKPTHNWRQIKTLKDARLIASKARKHD